jgi:hypothetical protein
MRSIPRLAQAQTFSRLANSASVPPPLSPVSLSDSGTIGPLGFPTMAKTPKPRSDTDKMFDALALAVGRICIVWGRLEHDLDEFIEVLAPLEAGDISRAITSELDIRSKLQTIKALAYIRKPSDEWFNKVIILLDYIDNNLRDRRNKCVHSGWYFKDNEFTMVSNKIRLHKPQSRQLVLHTTAEFKVKLGDVNALADEMEGLFRIMFHFWCDYACPGTLPPLPAKFFQQFLRRAKPDAPLTYVRSIRQYPPRSSPKSGAKKQLSGPPPEGKA